MNSRAFLGVEMIQGIKNGLGFLGCGSVIKIYERPTVDRLSKNGEVFPYAMNIV